MEFCPKCDNLLNFEKKNGKVILVCPECGYKKNLAKSKVDSYRIKEEIVHNETDRIEVIESEEDEGIPEEIREELLESYRESLEGFQY